MEGGGNSDLSVEELPLPTEGGVTALGFVPSVGNLIPSVESHPTPSLTANGVNYNIHSHSFVLNCFSSGVDLRLTLI